MWSRKQVKIFVSFLVFGVVIGLIENLIAIHFATSHAIDLRAVVISFLVVVPFAALGELIVDRHSLIPHAKSARLQRLEVFLEFLVFGMVMGVVEDLIVITLLTGEPVTLQVVWIVFLVTLPFAVLGELVVDRAKWFVWLQSKGLFLWVDSD
ncbi:MAG: hypothetical protein ACMXYD_00225 [Candidatus Woesearchaeota archaeon]